MVWTSLSPPAPSMDEFLYKAPPPEPCGPLLPPSAPADLLLINTPGSLEGAADSDTPLVSYLMKIKLAALMSCLLWHLRTAEGP